MNTYETSATVQPEGQVHVAGVPFAPGTEVDVTISPTQSGAGQHGTNEASRAQRLLAALDKGRNSETVGPLRRAELYDRNILH
jgi:hypothetical protein